MTRKSVDNFRFSFGYLWYNRKDRVYESKVTNVAINYMKEFEGELKDISPARLIKKEKPDNFDNFFLILGLIFNDLKDLILFSDLFSKTYRIPKLDGSEPVSVHLGQWAGAQNHINRLIISFISEFLIFLDKNKNLINTTSFRFFEKKLPPNVRQDWSNILRVLNDEKAGDFLSEIARIRNNVSSHYDHSLKELRTGFVKKFFDSNKNEYNKRAFYSLGSTMETTRFYYCDGAVEEYIKEHMKISSSGDYNENIRMLVKKTNGTIRFMMETYLKYKVDKKI